jgi:hypothetical protein
MAKLKILEFEYKDFSKQYKDFEKILFELRK